MHFILTLNTVNLDYALSAIVLFQAPDDKDVSEIVPQEIHEDVPQEVHEEDVQVQTIDIFCYLEWGEL